MAKVIYILLGWEHGLMHYVGKAVSFVMPGLEFEPYALNITVILLVTCFFSPILPHCLLKFAAWLSQTSTEVVKFNAFRKHSGADYTTEFASLIFRSAEQGLPVAFTMDNHKVYIGYPSSIDSHVNDIELIPVASGYRCKETLALKLTTDYYSVMKDLHAKYKSKKSLKNSAELANLRSTHLVAQFFISLPIREIAHANLHDLSYYDLFRKHEIKPDKYGSIVAKIKSKREHLGHP